MESNSSTHEDVKKKGPDLIPVETSSGRYFIKDRLVNEAGEPFYRVIPVEEATNPKNTGIFVSPGARSPIARDINKTLDDIYYKRTNDRPLNMVLIPGADPKQKIIAGLTQPLTPAERKICHPDGTMLGEYSEGVAQRVDDCRDCAIENQAIHFFADLHASSLETGKSTPTMFDIVKSRAQEIAIAEFPALGLEMTPEETKSLFTDSQPKDFVELLKGEQLNEKGEPNGVRYSGNHSFRSQTPHLKNIDTTVQGNRTMIGSMAFNYGLQMATIEAFANHCNKGYKDGARTVSIAEANEIQLHRNGLTAGMHPGMKSQDFADISSNYGFQIGSRTLLGLMEATSGAEPAYRAYDSLEQDRASVASGEHHASAFLHLNVVDRVDKSLTAEQRMAQYTVLAKERSDKVHSLAQMAVGIEQDKSRPKKPKEEKKAGAVGLVAHHVFQHVLPDVFKHIIEGIDSMPRTFG